MTLQNLLAIKRLQEHVADGASIRKLLSAARENLADAAVTQSSAGTRFDAAYKCIMQCAMLGLWANGYRAPKSQPGHHQTAIQCLEHTMGVGSKTLIVLDALRKQRNLSDYEGDPVSAVTLASCVKEATKLLAHTERWLKQNHPEWMDAR